MKLVKESLFEDLNDDSRYNFLKKNPTKNSNPVVIKDINFLESILSPEGFKVVEKFMRGGLDCGYNRYWIIRKLADTFDPESYYEEPKLTKSDLRSYSNTVLYELIETGDLVKLGRKLVPHDYIEKQDNLY